MLAFLGQNLGLVVGLSYVESKFGPKPNNAGPGGLSSLVGITPLLLSCFSFWTVLYGFSAGAARKKYSELAKADNEPHVEARYMLPNLYAQGVSKHVQAFNCVQRSHQHIFETFTQIVVTSIIGAISYPITSAIITSTYIIGRVSMSKAYAAGEGDASKRYSSPYSRLNWYGLVSSMILAMLSSVKMILPTDKKQLLW